MGKLFLSGKFHTTQTGSTELLLYPCGWPTSRRATVPVECILYRRHPASTPALPRWKIRCHWNHVGRLRLPARGCAQSDLATFLGRLAIVERARIAPQPTGWYCRHEKVSRACSSCHSSSAGRGFATPLRFSRLSTIIPCPAGGDSVSPLGSP